MSSDARRCGRSPAPRSQSLFTALTIIAVWSACSVVIKASSGASPPIAYAALRATIAAFTLLLLAGFSGKLRLPRRELASVVAFGLTNTALGLSAMFVGVGLGGAALPAVLANSQALLVAPCAAFLFQERLTRLRLSGLVVGLGGLTVILAGTPEGGGGVAGMLVSVSAAVGLAAGNLLMKYLDGRVDALTAVAWHYLFGAVPLLGWALLMEDWTAIHWSAGFVGALVFLGLAGSAGATYVWYRLVEQTELISLNALTLLIPIISVLFSLAIYREPLGIRSAIGAFLVIGGVIAVGWPSRSTTRPLAVD